MATVHIPHDYLCYKTPCVPAPSRIMQFFYQVMAFDDVETVLDFIAYCLWRELRFHKLLLFNGSGRNGKGVTTQLITRFLGRQNVSNETLHRILENRFASAKLFGKMANIDADMSSQALRYTGILKMLTGGDDLPAEHKFKPAFSLIYFSKDIPLLNTVGYYCQFSLSESGKEHSLRGHYYPVALVTYLLLRDILFLMV